MAVEQGIVMLLQANSAVAAISPGGWYAELPPNAPLPNWSYLTVFKHPVTGLQALPGLIPWRVQFDCYSENDNGLGAVSLAGAITGALSGYRGTLSDQEHTYVDSAIWEDEHDFFDAVRRSWRRLTEFTVWYAYGAVT